MLYRTPGEFESAELQADLVAVAMLGARMHYAVPVLLHRAGLLDRFFTDSYRGNQPLLEGLLRAVPATLSTRGMRRWQGRQHPDLPSSKVTSFETLGLWYAFARWRARGSADAAEHVYEEVAQRFSSAILRQGLGRGRIVWGFNTASLELFVRAKAEGRLCILEQTILPRRLEAQLLHNVGQDWPGWQPGFKVAGGPRRLAEREAQEWSLADRIVVGSQFVLDGLVACGVAPEKISVIPYGVDPEQFSPPTEQRQRQGPLRVLFVGEVGLRKGAPYLLEALRRLGPKKVEAKLAGRVALDQVRLRPYAEVANFLGGVPRLEMPRLFHWADVFVLPSIMEGSATVTYEALLSGLPVIATPNAGSIVRDGVDGRIVPIRNVDALVQALEAYAEEPSLLRKHAEQARAGRQRASLKRYGDDLVRFFRELGMK